MSSLKLVQRTVQETGELDPFKEKRREEEVAETAGVVLSDGRCLELIRDDAGQLSLLDSNRKRGAQQIKYQGRTYVPPRIDASLLEALTLPTGRAFASIKAIFTRVCALFTDQGISDQTARKLFYWMLATWFLDLFPLAPYLLITGPQLEAHLVLQLLACLVRHGLPLADINLSGWLSLPMHVQPTLLLGRLSPGMRKMLSASNYARAYLPTRGGLANLHCAKAVYAGTHLVDTALDSAFRVHLAPFHGKLPVLSNLAQRNLAAAFQPLLLDYRMRYVGEVRDSFDVPSLGSELRMLARVLGSAIVDPELRGDLVNLLREYQEESAAGNAFNAESIVVEGLFSHIHSEQSDQLLYVGQLADIANSILKDRGLREKVEPKALGWILRNSLGFAPKRSGKGFALRLTQDVRRKIHQIAREFQVLTVNEAATVCSQCAEILTSDSEEGSSNSEPK